MERELMIKESIWKPHIRHYYKYCARTPKVPSDGGQEKTKAIQHHQLSHDSPSVGGCTQLGHAMNIKK